MVTAHAAPSPTATEWNREPFHQYRFDVSFNECPWAERVLGMMHRGQNFQIAFRCKPHVELHPPPTDLTHYEHAKLRATIQSIEIIPPGDSAAYSISGSRANEPLGAPLCPHWSLQRWLRFQFGAQLAATALANHYAVVEKH